MSDKKLDLLAEIAEVLRAGEFASVSAKEQIPGCEVVGELDDQEKACFTVFERLTSEMKAICAAACGGEHREPCPEETRLRSLDGKKDVVKDLMWQLVRDRLNLWGNESRQLTLGVGWKVFRLPPRRQQKSGVLIIGRGGGLVGRSPLGL